MKWKLEKLVERMDQLNVRIHIKNKFIFDSKS